MFVAAATTALLALSTVAEAARPKHDNPLKRALPASGCTCNGQTAPSSSEVSMPTKVALSVRTRLAQLTTTTAGALLPVHHQRQGLVL